MDGLIEEAAARMPLAEAAFAVWRWIANEPFLEGVYEPTRGRGFTRCLTFSVFVQLIADALLLRDGSGREAFEDSRERGELPVSIQAAYGKLRRIAPQVSEAFLAEGAARLRSLWPDGAEATLPASVAQFDVLIFDGKTIKGLHKRLKPLREVGGGVVGGKALVAVQFKTGLVIAMQTHLDGDANEVRLTPNLLANVRSHTDGQRLWVGDRAFSYVEQVLQLGAAPDDFLVRRRSDITFERDPRRRTRAGRDAAGRGFYEEWGWLSRHGQARALFVRQLTLTLSKTDTLVLITSLLDRQRYPARDLLALYRQRWHIERVFQDITEVFGLKHLIGSSPQASLFQFALCLMLYNMIQVVRAYIAVHRRIPTETISAEKLFRDVRRQLSAWLLLFGPQATWPSQPAQLDVKLQRAALHQILREAWSNRWAKSPPQRRATQPSPRGHGKHVSAQKVLDRSRKRHQ
jgi:IS4 transposase